MAGADLTNFTEYCYQIIEEEEVTYHAQEIGCPAHILKYYDGFAFGIHFNYYSDDQYDTHANNTTLYDYYMYIYICPGDSMDCAAIWMDHSSNISGDYVYWDLYNCKLNTYGLEDGDTWYSLDKYDCTRFYNLDYPNYGFSSTQFGTIMNIDDDGDGDDEYWFDYNSGMGYMHLHRFLAVNDERLDIGDTLTFWVMEYENYEVISTSVELASGVSLAASAAAVLASATLL